MDDLSIKEIDELQNSINDSYKFVSSYLKQHPINELENEYSELRQYIEFSKEFRDVEQNFDDGSVKRNKYVTSLLPDEIAMQKFFNNHKEFIGHFNFMKKYRGYYYDSFFVEFMIRIELKFYQSELKIPFIRVGIL